MHTFRRHNRPAPFLTPHNRQDNVGFVNAGSADASPRIMPAFRKGLNQTGYVESKNVNFEYHWVETTTSIPKPF